MNFGGARQIRRRVRISAIDRNGLLAPSFGQQRLWFLSQMDGVSEAYHIPFGLRLRGPLDEDALVAALDRLVTRHEVLRTSFITVDGEVFQHIGSEDTTFSLRREDLSGLDDSDVQLLDQIQAEASTSFDLEHGPLVRGRLIRMAAEEHVLLVTMHHIVSDGWSRGILTRELSALYKAYGVGGPDPLAPLEIQYADYAAWQRQWLSGEVLAEQSAYWQRRLSGAPGVIELPTDRRRPFQQDFTGGSVRVELDEIVTEGLKALSQRYGLTLFMTVLAGWALVLSRLSGQEDMVIGVPSANRGRLEIEGLIGFFVNTLALRVDLSGTPTLETVLERVKTTTLEAQIHQDLPFEQVVDLVKPARNLGHTPVFQVMLSWQNNEGGGLDLPGIQVERIGGGQPPPAKFDLTLNLREANGRIVGNLNYAAALFDQETIERWVGYLRNTLVQMVANAQQVASALPILPPEERHKLLVEWNATEAEYPNDKCIHELFEVQVAADPAAMAVVNEGKSLSYGELNRKALSTPDADAHGRGEYEAPMGLVETVLVRIWSEVLGVERIGRYDNFFELGGRSLLAIRVLERMRQAGLKSDVRTLFTTPVLSDLAVAVDKGGDIAPPIERIARDGLLLPSFGQQRLWFLSQMDGVSEAYHIPFGLRLRGPLDEDALVAALDRLVTRHEVLRTSFITVDGEVFQHIGSEDTTFSLRREDLSGLDDSDVQLLDQIQAEASASFDLEHGPLVRGRLIRMAAEEHVLLVTMHHIVSDGWSRGILTRELSALYKAYGVGGPDPLAPLEIQYADYAAWQRQWLSGEVLAEQSAYWQRRLSGVPGVIELPTDRRRPFQQDFTGGSVRVELDEIVTEGLKALSQRYGLTLFMTVLAGWALVLSRLSGQEDMVIGVPSANRGRLEIEGLIGFFVNTLALRVDLSGTPTLETVLERVKTTTLEAQIHQDLPFEQVVDLVKPARNLGHTPVFQVMLSWQNNEGGGFDLPGIQVGRIGGGQPPPAKFDLTLNLREANGRIVGNLNYAAALFDQETIERWVGYLRNTLVQMVANAQQVASALPILPPEERHKLLVEWNATEAEYPNDKCIHELFEVQVDRDPEAVAVVYEDQSLSYGELNARANRLAHHLRNLGVKPDAPVAICVERSLEMVVGLLAILKAGGCYVPLDPEYPAERLAFMLEDSAPSIVLTHGAAQPSLQTALAQAGLSVSLFDLEADSADWSIYPATNPDLKTVGLTSQHLAYIIYTSGSTGQPKGVMIEHRNVTRLFTTTQVLFCFDHKDVWTLFHSFAFDFSVWEAWGALLHGGRLIVVPQIMARSPHDFYDLLCNKGVTILNQTPSAFRSLIAAQSEAAHYLRHIIFGGEALEVATLYPWYQREQNRQTDLINMYGITETTIHATYHSLDVADIGRLNGSPIGSRIQDLRIYLLDGMRNPVPLGVAGEIYIGGAGVARGYLNRPDLTEERFIESPFVAGDRLYKTGDLGRYLPDGNIEFLGRNDFQVKIRGFRIELGEIEARLTSHPLVKEAVVLAREDEAGDKRLVGYYTASQDVANDTDEAGVLGAEELRGYLSATLPDYMVPAAYVRLDALPLTPNGKLDRKALPAPEGDAYGRGIYEAPIGPAETALAEIWSEVLGVERIGRYDNFFELGGHSLLAIRVLERMRRAGLNGDVRALFATPVLSDLAVAVDKGGDIAPPIERIARDGLLLPSFGQQRLWFLSQMDGVSEAYHIPFGLRLRGPLDEDALVAALDRLVTRHEVLRTSFITVDGEVFQHIGSEDTTFSLRREDLSGLDDSDVQLLDQIQAEASASFDLEHGPLVRGRLIRMAAEEHVLLVTMHHIVSDGWSRGILTRELSALYKAYGVGGPDPLAPLEIQYADYAAWQRQWLSGEVLAEQSAYWQRRLSGVPGVIELPTDRRRPFQQDFTGGSVRVELDEIVTEGLKALSQRYGLTLFMTVLAGWALVLSRLSGQEDMVIGVPSANRGRLEIEGLIGFFVNTLALRVDLSGTPTLETVLERVKTTTLEAQIHQDLPFEQVVDLVKPARNLGHTPVFQVMLSWQNNEGGGFDLPGIQVERIGGGQPVAQFDLTLNLREANGRIVGNLNYAAALFDQETIERWVGYLRNTLVQMVANAQQVASALPILPPEERHKLLVEWNATEAEYPNDKCIHELFEVQVDRDPEAVAVVYEDQSLSYGELNARANRLAHHLRNLGVKPDAPVAICVERSLEMVVGLLAILKAGGCYVPLDPEYPAERLAFMLEDSAPSIVLTHGAAQPSLQTALAQAGLSVSLFDLEADSADWSIYPATNPDLKTVGLTSQHLAYIIYTSGSTGQPKGVMIEHRNVINYLAWGLRAYRAESGCGAPVNTPFAFDATVTSLMIPLMVGRVVTMVPEGPNELLALAEMFSDRRGFSLAKLTPMHLTGLRDLNTALACEGAAGVLVIGGDELTWAQIAKWRMNAPRVRVINEYGPTEATVGCVVHEFTATTPVSRIIPIGRPISNTRIYLLDGMRNPVPLGVAGEIYIGGAGVARGYLNRPDLTEERFIESPFVAGDRLYKTGDLGRYLPDGNIEFLGRNDFQVKIRGFRIELGEIEARLTSHPLVKEAVVLAREDEAGDKRLVGYYTAPGVSWIGAEMLRGYLSATLPDYMVPAAYVRLDALPLTPNGKLDRKALPAPEGDAYGRGIYEAPIGPAETALAEIWSEVLGVERIGRYDNFFELGGHSLLAIRVLERMRRAGLNGDVRALFATPVLSDLAVAVDKGGDIAPPIERIARDGLLLPSFGQQRLWFLSQMDGVSEAYHIPFGLRLRGPLDEDALVAALDRLVTRHEVLRTSFITVDGEVFQHIGSEDTTFSLRREDLSGLDDSDVQLLDQIQAEASASFDLEHGPLVRGRLIRMAAEEHVLLVTMHHIVSDGWSRGILTRELSALYKAYGVGGPDPLAPLEIQYADYAAWQRQWLSGEVLAEQSAYWQRRLSGVPGVIELPTDRRRPFQQDFTGGSVRVELDEIVTEGLKALSQRYGLTLFMTVLAGWALVLSRLSGQEDMVIGVPSANRGRLEIEGLIGFFVNTLALRVDLSGTPTLETVLERVKTTTLEAQIHQDLPFEQVVDLVKPARNLGHTPVFQVMLSWQNNEGGGFDLPGIQVERIGGGQPVAQFDLTLNLREANGRIVGNLNYAAALFDQETIERWVGYLRNTLVQMVANAQQVASALPILPPEERHKLLVEWNATEAEYPNDKCIHELFEVQVDRDPEAVAVVYEDQSLSYGELNARANRLAHHLRNLGVKPDAPVAICVERSLEMVVGLLAILKAGGCYVPLDPEYPAERLAFMLEDSAPSIVLTHGAAQPSLQTALAQAGLSVSLFDLEADSADWSIYPATNPDLKTVGLTSQHLAYIIYTSGSTGQPKGVMIEHRGLINRLLWMQTAYEIDSTDATLQKTPFSFDVSVWEFFLTLMVGAKLVMALPDEHKNANYLVSAIRKYGITVTHFVPSMLDIFLEKKGAGTCLSLRKVFCSGEELLEQSVKRFRDIFVSTPLYNLYGPTEATIDVTAWDCSENVAGFPSFLPIGRPISNTRIYLLDGMRNPVPLGVAGEIYIGGAGVARGYLNRPDLTEERFIESPFVAGDRLYKTGDLGRYLPDGNIEFLGRNDFQVKIRGFRIELGEIEARLTSHPLVKEAVVLAREDEAGDKRLVGYYTASQDVANDTDEAGVLGAEELRGYLSATLPDYMVPAAYVRLDALPLTPNGKLDRKALPAPEGDAYGRGIYEAPIGPAETALAEIWSEVLGVERIGRYDNFFELGGHSLLAIRVLERMRRAGLNGDVRALFATPVLSDLAVAVDKGGELVEVPANRIEQGCEAITPDLLPLIDLTQGHIDSIVATVPGGSANVQDIYPLAPLQEGILFHHLMVKDGDPYVLRSQMSFSSRAKLDDYLTALNEVIARHDILRTAFVWEGLLEPVQVVWRNASVMVEEVALDPKAGDIAEQLKKRFNPRHYRLDVGQAPLQRLFTAYDAAKDRWVMVWLFHHLCIDHATLEVMRSEIRTRLMGQFDTLPEALPFRNFVAQARLGVSRQEHEAFFSQMLRGVDEPTAPFGLMDVQGDGSGVGEARVRVDADLAKRLRARTRALGVSAASLFHVAWGMVLARCSGQQDPVFGTVLFGRMQGRKGVDRALGLFINTLPLRIPFGGRGVEQSVLGAHRLLADLMHHEHASLALAQRCSGVPAPAPLFTALLNYRYSAVPSGNDAANHAASDGINYLGSEDRTNYPIMLSIDDLGKEFSLRAQAVAPLDPRRLCAMMHRALEQLVWALETNPTQPVGQLDILPPEERHKLLVEWNATEAEYPNDKCIHELFEVQVDRDPEAVAVVYEDQSLSYGELNARANRLAHHLRNLGVKPDAPVAICVERSLEMVVGLLAILKAGGCYVPLDPEYPAERLAFMLEDSAPSIVLTHGAAQPSLQTALAQAGLSVSLFDLEADSADWSIYPATNPDLKTVGLTSQHLAYIIYTSGSTGQPKGVIVEHRNVINYLSWVVILIAKYKVNSSLVHSDVNFDLTVTSLLPPLMCGGSIKLLIRLDKDQISPLLIALESNNNCCFTKLTPSHLTSLRLALADKRPVYKSPMAFVGGEQLTSNILLPWWRNSPNCQFINHYGPTETTVGVCHLLISNPGIAGNSIPIGRPISNTRIYLLDGMRNPVPLGVAGEIYIGGAGVARGYLNRPDLTEERFIESPFVAGDRLYKTGDLGRYLPDGNIEFLGRNDFQVKIRGFRIELGEIEARLTSHPLVKEAVVLAREDEAGDKRLVGYYTAPGVSWIGAEMLRGYLSATLPDYMVPAAYVRLDALPLTPNGKLDRKALPAPEGDAYGRGIYEAPIGPAETALAEIWSEVLGVERIGRYDNFFELGGHSLLAIRIFSRVHELFGINFSIASLFKARIFSEFAEEIFSEIALRAKDIKWP